MWIFIPICVFFATKKKYMFWYEVTNQPNRSMCFICQWLSYIQKCNSNHGRYWYQILRLILLMFFTSIMGPYMPHEGKLWYFWVFAYLVNIHIRIWTRLVRNVLHMARITSYHWSQPIMYEFHNIPLKKKGIHLTFCWKLASFKELVLLAELENGWTIWFKNYVQIQ